MTAPRPAREGQGPRTKTNRPARVPAVKMLAGPGREPRDWAQTDRRLRARGDLTVLVDPAVLLAPRTGRGRAYPPALIEAAMVVSVMFGLPLRQTEGFLGWLTRTLGLVDVPVPDHTTLCRRRRTLTLPRRPLPTGPRVLVIDATGITVRSPGRWIEKYGRDERRRRFVKLHIGIDQVTGRVLADVVTPGDGPGTGDVSVGPDLIRDAGEVVEVSAVLADRAYDAGTCYQAARDVGAVVVTPPKAANGYGKDPTRDVHLAQIGRLGEPEWRRRVGYGQRAQVESWFSGLKRATADRVRARSFEGAAAEVLAAVAVYDAWLSM